MMFFFSSRRRHTRWTGDWSSDVCSSDLDRLTGTVVTGGLEYELTLDNGVVEYQSINVLETSAGRIFVRSCGVARDKDSERSEEHRVGKECRCRWSPYH